MRNSSAVIAPWRETLLRLQSRLQRTTAQAAPRRQARLALSRQRLAVAMQRTPTVGLRVESMDRRLTAAMHMLMSSRTARLTAASQALALLNPDHVLDRGYALVFTHAGTPVTDAATVRAGTSLRIRFQRGEADATVTATRDNAK